MQVSETNLALYPLLTFFGMVGVMARIGLTRLTSFEHAAYGGVLWANFAGSLIMGLLQQNMLLFGSVLKEEIPKQRNYQAMGEIPLFVALGTGLCGSITSFSSFILELFEISALDQQQHPGNGVMAWLSYFILTLAVSVGGFRVGQHITRMFGEIVLPLAKHERLIEICLGTLGVAGWVVCLVLACTKQQGRYWTLCCVFGPFGVFGRYWLHRLMNHWSKTFKWGTFTANVLATAILAMLVLLQRGKPSATTKLVTSHLQCDVLMGLQDGLCGNFSTISTFVNEMVSMKRMRHAYFYSGTSILSGFAAMVVILGTYTWTHGLASTCYVS